MSSGYLAAGSVAALDAGAVVLMAGSIDFQASIDASVHMENAPLPLNAGGTMASPVVSLFQQDLIGLRSVLRASWAKRRAGAAAIATGVTW